jgi:aspartyl/glutamyl-tRNA(Asn/Gln) amidotransferase C subunit
MADKVDIEALAKLARLEVSAEEMAKLEKEIPSILEFVATVQIAAADAPKEEPTLQNVMREDENPHESGIYTEKLLSASPAREGDRIAVKQVISRKK